MTARIHSSSQTVQIELTQRLDYFPVSDSVVVFKLSWEPKFEAQAIPPCIGTALPTGVTQGFADARAMAAYAAGTCSKYTRAAAAAEAKVKYTERELADEPSSRISLVPSSLLSLIQAKGFVSGWEAESSTEVQAIAAQAFDLLRNGKASLAQVVRFDYSAHMVFDLQDRPLPMAVSFDYSNGRISEGQYDLAKLVALLKTDARVALQNVDSPILPVPYYNVSAGCSKHVPFVFSPTAADMLALWPVMNRLNRKHPSTTFREAVFELDLLGLRAAGIARFPKYWDSPPQPESDDND